MKQSIFVIALLFGVASLAQIKSRVDLSIEKAEKVKKYHAHCAKHGRGIKSKEDFESRMAKFSAVDHEIETHNKDEHKHGWAKGHNKFSDMHDDEKNAHNGHKNPEAKDVGKDMTAAQI